MWIYNLIAIIFFSLILIKSADVLSTHLKTLAKKTKLGGFVLTSLIVGLATSFPELFVGITSALSGVPNLSLGNVIGANIANVTLVAGGAALIGGSIKIKNHSYASDLLHAFLASMAPLFLLMDNSLSRVDGLILIALYGYYNVSILRKRMPHMIKQDGNVFSTFLKKFKNNKSGKELMYIFASTALILFSAQMIVDFGKTIANQLGISLLLVGLLIVSVGTTLPELAVDIKAVIKKDTELFLGNMLGSIVANATLVIGLVALIYPIHIEAYTDYVFSTIIFLLLFVYFYFFVRTKERLDRWEGLLLVGVYVLFMVIEFAR